MAALCGTALSQSANVFENEAPAVAAAAEAEEAPLAEESPAAPEIEIRPVDSTPSRFAGEELEAYVLARSSVFSMRNRETDPFGLYQDPDVQRAVKQQIVADQPSKRAAIAPTPLSDIIKLIRITTIMPSDRSFLVGTRSFSEGEEFPLVFQGKRMNMKVLSVDSRKILFRNLDNSEDATLEMDFLPPGMIAGSDTIRPAGMASEADNLPLELGGANN